MYVFVGRRLLVCMFFSLLLYSVRVCVYVVSAHINKTLVAGILVCAFGALGNTLWNKETKDQYELSVDCFNPCL